MPIYSRRYTSGSLPGNSPPEIFRVKLHILLQFNSTLKKFDLFSIIFSSSFTLHSMQSPPPGSVQLHIFIFVCYVLCTIVILCSFILATSGVVAVVFFTVFLNYPCVLFTIIFVYSISISVTVVYPIQSHECTGPLFS